MVARASNRIERETIVEEFATLKSGRDAMKEAYKLFDDITLSKPFRFMVISKEGDLERIRLFIHSFRVSFVHLDMRIHTLLTVLNSPY